MAVSLLLDALTGVIRGFLTKIDVDVLAYVNVNVFFVMSPCPLEEFRC